MIWVADFVLKLGRYYNASLDAPWALLEMEFERIFEASHCATDSNFAHFFEDVTRVKTPSEINPPFKDVRNWKMRKDNLDLWIEQEIAKKVEECKQAGL